MRVKLVGPENDEWTTCVDVVRERYEKDYDATVTPDPDQFVMVEDDEGSKAVAGISEAGDSEVMAETYLDDAVENTLADELETELPRSEVVEIGPLASSGSGVGKTLVLSLPALAWARGARALVCTVTGPLAAMLRRTRIGFRPLVDATLDHLPRAERGRWGSYYDTEPVTGYVDLRSFDADLVDGGQGASQVAIRDRDLESPDLESEAS
jgi:Rad3-related DNA helicase